ncbi:F-box/LRR-repeat/kelch-repeat protein At2g27520-like isoform X2 [Silene latifolia]|uniref:F-box/LRR-repeat/kelch-repeat protein At2g27520-like isoform X2 n=1 Tax=Silene latifolia TaxID=37657 RepID=UPI003D774462
MVEGYFDRLPCDILHNIALMLPFSSIKQLRYSSKFWYNLLTDPKFVDLQLTQALQKPPGYLFTPITKSWPKKKVCYFVEQSGGHLSTSKIFEYTYDHNEPEQFGRFQSSGGLMCAYLRESCYFRIFNPYIGEQVQVPRDSNFKRWRFFSFIFSYSPSIKEYKILKIGRLYSGPIVGEICTLGSNIWRDLQDVPSNLWYCDPHTQCQGNLFWMEEHDLHFFDIVSEKLHVIPGPPVFNRVHVTHYSNTYEKLMRNSLISMGHTVGYVHNNGLWVLEDKTKGIWMKSHDMGCTGLRVMELNLGDVDEEQQRRAEFIAPHVRSFVSPVRIMKMGKMLNDKEKSVLDTLKLDYDATKDDLINRMYEFLQAYQKNDKSDEL